MKGEIFSLFRSVIVRLDADPAPERMVSKGRSLLQPAPGEAKSSAGTTYSNIFYLQLYSVAIKRSLLYIVQVMLRQPRCCILRSDFGVNE